MKKIKLGKSSLTVSEICLGLMRISESKLKDNTNLVKTALEHGINFFDHADIYGAGECEKIFAQVMKSGDIARDSILIQSKCAIRKGCFDFSYDYIISSVEGILKRLNTDYIDVLLLHRPDTLMEPEEVAKAFDMLHSSGKVRHFGVSNQKPLQIELLQKYVKQDLVANQLQLSLTNTGMIDSGLNVNMQVNQAIDHDDSILEYCRLNDITIQPWSPFQYGWFEGTFIDNPQFEVLNNAMAEIGENYGISKTTLAIAWLLRHPAKMQPIIGSTNANRVAEVCVASSIYITREEWYKLYIAAGNTLP